MKRTEEQQAVVDSATSGQNLVAEARAGCGKTHTAKEIASSNPRKKVVLVVFNKKNEVELNKDSTKPSNLEASTFSSKCLRTLGGRRNIKVKKFESGKWTKGKNEEIILKDPLFNPFRKDLQKEDRLDIKDNHDAAIRALSLMKNTFLSPTRFDVLNLMNLHQISPGMQNGEFAERMIEFLSESDEDQYNVDFDDMIRFCVLGKKGGNILQDIFILDECQDNTPIRTMLLGQVQENSQVAAIGDDRQAVYLFAGAGADSVKQIVSILNDCERLKLTTNFRCDKLIIEEAKKIVPDIRALDSKPDGTVIRSEMKDLLKHFQPGDVGIARYNAVIIGKAFSFIKEGKPATIQGADFGAMLKSQVKTMGTTDLGGFYSKLSSWYEKQCEYSDDNPSEAVKERFACLKFLADNSDTVDQIATTIDTIFSDKQSIYTFSTGHKSKGLEWDGVHILESNNFISRREGISQEQQVQEQNLFYIAVTRARHRLNMCATDSNPSETIG